MSIPATSGVNGIKNITVTGTGRYFISVDIFNTDAVSIIPTLTYNNTTGVLSVINTSLSLLVNVEGVFNVLNKVPASQTYTCNLTIRMYLVV